MTRLKATISYDGTEFAGYQVQPGKRTVQLEIEKVLAKMQIISPKKKCNQSLILISKES